MRKSRSGLVELIGWRDRERERERERERGGRERGGGGERERERERERRGGGGLRTVPISTFTATVWRLLEKRAFGAPSDTISFKNRK